MEVFESSIPFNRLVIEGNMRSVKPSKQKDKELISTIRAEGVLQNLIVAAIPNSDKFAVGAGGRRTSSVAHLISKQDSIAGEPATEEYPMPCKVVPYEKLSLYSLIENHGREGVHPADEFMAFNKLALEGQSEDQIAATFGVKKSHVRKLLKLATVSPTLIAQFKAGKMSLDAIMAFTVTVDQEKQIACYDALKPRLYAHNIRGYLTDTYMCSTDPIVKFVTLAAYRKAGGVTEEDMFQSTIYVVNVDLVQELAHKKLEKARVKAQGDWAWAEQAGDYESAHKIGRQLEADFHDVPDHINKGIDDANKAIDALYDKDDWEDADQEEEDRLIAIIEDLEDQREEYRYFTDEQKAVGGCVVYIDQQGKLQTLRGIVKKKDEKALKAKADSVESGSGTEPVEHLESQKLRDTLDSYYLQAFQAEMLKHEQLAYDVMVYSLAVKAFSGPWCSVSSIDLRRDQSLNNIKNEETVAGGVLSDAKSALTLGWLEAGDEAQRFEAFKVLPNTDKRKILTYCVAISMGNPLNAFESSELNVVKADSGFDLSQYWQPTKENYFGFLQKKNLLKIGGMAIDEQWVDDHQKWKGAELQDLLPSLDQLNGWMPPYLNK